MGFYLSQHTQVAHLPLSSIVDAFQHGVDEAGLLDSRLPDLTQMMTQIPDTRQFWFEHRKVLETVGRDLSDPCLFMTINPEPRSHDTRALIYQLEHPNQPFDRE